MKKLRGLSCALALAALVPMCAAAEEPAAPEQAAPAVTAPPAPAATAEAAPAVTAPPAEAPAAATTAEAAPAAAAMSDKEKISYSLGASWGKSLKDAKLDLDMDRLVQGMRDAQAGRTLALSDREIQSALDKMRAELKQKQEEHAKEVAEQMKEQGEKNKVEGPKFLEENKKNEGVVTQPNGLQYKVLEEGTGKPPGPTDIVTLEYRARFPDGTEWDSSSKYGRPLEVALDKPFLPGLLDALKMMKVGSKWMVYIPSDLAYGERGKPPIIPPNAVLVFEVTVLGIKEKPKEAPAPAAQ
jgi:FKBP-type peptidyl-prolyl cis-trans isomerase FklB